jgi:hypothetical protein
VVHVMLFRLLKGLYVYINTPLSVCAVRTMAVFNCPVVCAFPVWCLGIFLNGFEMVPFVHVVFGITFVFTLYMCCTSIVRSV